MNQGTIGKNAIVVGGSIAGLVTARVLADRFDLVTILEQKAPQWLDAIGYPTPPEITIDTAPHYATRIYQIPPDFNEDWQGIVLQAAPPERNRLGILYPIEGHRWIVGVCGMGKDKPPREAEGFTAYLKSLPSEVIYDAIARAEPLTPVMTYSAPGNRLRQYELLSRQPDNFLVIGDAACTFNPIYGQGMTVAILGAKTLARCLEDFPKGQFTGLARRFQQALSEVDRTPWLLATSQDRLYPDLQGSIDAPNFLDRLVTRYMNQIVKLTTKNTSITKEFFKFFTWSNPGGVTARL
jgi:2-polyprenyl-6-methoxyphenol hydroxylase-like FAD-dependent oxidoreductase